MVHAYHDKVIILILQGKFGGQLLTALLAKVSQTFLFWQKNWRSHWNEKKSEKKLQKSQKLARVQIVIDAFCVNNNNYSFFAQILLRQKW